MTDDKRYRIIAPGESKWGTWQTEITQDPDVTQRLLRIMNLDPLNLKGEPRCLYLNYQVNH
jgi:hypothetical protein